MKRKAVSHKHLGVCIVLAFFNIADALFTHYFLLNGGTELNPLMRTLYENDPLYFIGVKFLFSILILVIGAVPLRNKIQRLISLAFAVYFVLVSYQLFLLIKQMNT